MYSYIPFFFLIFILGGCVNLKKVNDFSSNSTKSIKNFEDLEYSFTKACIEKCELEQLENNQIQKTKCECKSEKEADKISSLIYKAIKGYFEGMTNLSENKLTTYKFNALTKALKEGDFGDIQLNKKHIDSYAKISGILTRAITDSYRKRKISTYIGDANDAIKILLEALEFNMVSNLSKKLDVKKQRLESYYFDLSVDTTITGFEKKKIIEEYNTLTDEIDTRKDQIALYGKGLNNIAAGHQKLYDNRNKLNAGEIKEQLSQYSSDIQDIVDEFNKLKKEK